MTARTTYLSLEIGLESLHRIAEVVFSHVILHTCPLPANITTISCFGVKIANKADVAAILHDFYRRCHQGVKIIFNSIHDWNIYCFSASGKLCSVFLFLCPAVIVFSIT